MLSHIVLSKYWIFCWTPLIFILGQAQAQADHEKNTPPSPTSSQLSATLTDRAVSVATTNDANIDTPMHPHATAPAMPSAAETVITTVVAPHSLSPTGAIAQTPVRPFAPPAAQPSDLTGNKPQAAKKKPKSAAPLLEAFLDNPFNADTQPAIAIAPQRAPLSPTSEPDKTTPDNLSPPSDNSDLSDPELGVIEIQDPRQDPELGLIQLRSPLQDPELGVLELQQISPPAPRRPALFLSTYVTASSSDNVFLVQDPVQGRFGDNFIRPGISLIAFPSVGPSTNILASVETNLLRYEEQNNSSYDELKFRAGVRHRFTERSYGQLSFSSQLLFEQGYGEQFFTNNGIELTLGRRDSLTPQLTLDSYYQGQIFFSDPSEFSNILNSVGTYLNYRISPQWDTGIGYRLTVSDFTRQSRHETYQRITGQLRYSITPSVRMSLFGGLSYGRSSEERITFDDSFFGISFDATFSLF